ncbi:MAG: hypothetical protein WKG03_04550, partial [Telluria sp.]
MNRRLIAACLTVTLLVSGCLVPEKFDAKADFQADGAYTFTYVGTVVHAMAAMQIAQSGGKMGAQDEKMFQQEAVVLRKKPDVRDVQYKGDGRYQLSFASQRKQGEPLNALDFFKVRTDKDGVTTVSSAEVTPKARKELAQLGIKIDGTLALSLPKSAQVISHNATSTPKLFGLVG